MMRLAILILTTIFLLLAQRSNGQTDIYTANNVDKRNDSTTRVLKNGHLKKEIFFYKNKKTKAEYIYGHNDKTKRIIVYTENGDKSYKLRFLKTITCGRFEYLEKKCYYEKNKVIRREKEKVILARF
jgi:hypothetical protein